MKYLSDMTDDQIDKYIKQSGNPGDLYLRPLPQAKPRRSRRVKATLTPEEKKAVDERAAEVVTAVKTIVLMETAKRNGFASWAELAAAHGLADEEDKPNAIDLHGYHPDEINLTTLVRQAWETGAPSLTLIHGHGRNRGISPGFVNTNTGYFGLGIRSELRHDKQLAQWIKRSTLDCRHDGSTTIKLKANPNPSRTRIDMETVCQSQRAS